MAGLKPGTPTPRSITAHGQSRVLEVGFADGRDVANLRNYLGQYAPTLRTTRYGDEIWAHYRAGSLTPDTVLTGHFERKLAPVDLEGMLADIEEVKLDEAAKQMRIRAAD